MLLIGCAAKLDTAPTVEPSIGFLARIFGDYAAANGKGPASEAEFKQHLESLGKERLEAMGLADLEKALVSPRDQQPYLVNYAWQPPPPMEPTKAAYVIAEKTGKDGKKLVGFATGTVKEMLDSEFTAHQQNTAPGK